MGPNPIMIGVLTRRIRDTDKHGRKTIWRHQKMANSKQKRIPQNNLTTLTS